MKLILCLRWSLFFEMNFEAEVDKDTEDLLKYRKWKSWIRSREFKRWETNSQELSEIEYLFHLMR